MNEQNWTDEQINRLSAANDQERAEWGRLYRMMQGGEVEVISQDEFEKLSLERCPDDVVQELYPYFDSQREFGFYKEGFRKLWVVR